MKKPVIEPGTLISFLNGNLDEREATEVEAWYAASGENKKELEEIYRLLFIGKVAHSGEVKVEKFLTELKRKIGSQKRRRFFSRPSGIIIARVAGIVALAVLTVGGLALKKASDALSTPLVIETKLGERAHVILPDGSRACLNSCSSLEYRSPLYGRTREVKMTGEVYFDVEQGDKPFIVHSQGLQTRVLGTKFNIRANTDEDMVVVTLLEGSIYSIADRSTHGITVQPTEQVLYDVRAGTVRLFDCGTLDEAGEYIEWIDGKLHFDQEMLVDIARDLERYYNVEIVFMDEKLQYERFSCDFNTSDNIYHILSTLELTQKFGYWIKGQDVLIFRK